jgi:small neutral amino acid transporter SnatA (MarC family)
VSPVKFFLDVFVTLFVIIDPAGTVPVFLGLTRDRSDQDRKRLAGQATIVAFSVIVVFALFGRTILDYLGVGLPPPAVLPRWCGHCGRKVDGPVAMRKDKPR